MAALASAAAAIAAYLVYAHYNHDAVICSTGGCDTVARSEYSEIFGVPVGLLGVIGSLAILASLLRADRLGLAAGVALTVCGFIVAVYLVSVQLVVIDAVCDWCIVNDTLIVALLPLAVLRARGMTHLRSR
jgi:uncharacterized membrane protein